MLLYPMSFNCVSLSFSRSHALQFTAVALQIQYCSISVLSVISAVYIMCDSVKCVDLNNDYCNKMFIILMFYHTCMHRFCVTMSSLHTLVKKDKY